MPGFEYGLNGVSQTVEQLISFLRKVPLADLKTSVANLPETLRPTDHDLALDQCIHLWIKTPTNIYTYFYLSSEMECVKETSLQKILKGLLRMTHSNQRSISDNDLYLEDRFQHVLLLKGRPGSRCYMHTEWKDAANFVVELHDHEEVYIQTAQPVPVVTWWAISPEKARAAIKWMEEHYSERRSHSIIPMRTSVMNPEGPDFKRQNTLSVSSPNR